MPRKQTLTVIPSQLSLQQAKVAENAAKKARKKMAEEGAEDLRIKLTELIKKQIPQIEEDLQKMTAKDRCDTIAKLAPYVLPKLIQKPVADEPDEPETNELTELANRTAGPSAVN